MKGTLNQRFDAIISNIEDSPGLAEYSFSRLSFQDRIKLLDVCFTKNYDRSCAWVVDRGVGFEELFTHYFRQRNIDLCKKLLTSQSFPFPLEECLEFAATEGCIEGLDLCYQHNASEVNLLTVLNTGIRHTGVVRWVFKNSIEPSLLSSRILISLCNNHQFSEEVLQYCIDHNIRICHNIIERTVLHGKYFVLDYIIKKHGFADMSYFTLAVRERIMKDLKLEYFDLSMLDGVQMSTLVSVFSHLLQRDRALDQQLKDFILSVCEYQIEHKCPVPNETIERCFVLKWYELVNWLMDQNIESYYKTLFERFDTGLSAVIENLDFTTVVNYLCSPEIYKKLQICKNQFKSLYKWLVDSKEELMNRLVSEAKEFILNEDEKNLSFYFSKYKTLLRLKQNANILFKMCVSNKKWNLLSLFTELATFGDLVKDVIHDISNEEEVKEVALIYAKRVSLLDSLSFFIDNTQVFNFILEDCNQAQLNIDVFIKICVKATERHQLNCFMKMYDKIAGATFNYERLLHFLLNEMVKFKYDFSLFSVNVRCMKYMLQNWPKEYKTKEMVIATFDCWKQIGNTNTDVLERMGLDVCVDPDEMFLQALERKILCLTDYFYSKLQLTNPVEFRQRVLTWMFPVGSVLDTSKSTLVLNRYPKICNEEMKEKIQAQKATTANIVLPTIMRRAKVVHIEEKEEEVNPLFSIANDMKLNLWKEGLNKKPASIDPELLKVIKPEMRPFIELNTDENKKEGYLYRYKNGSTVFYSRTLCEDMNKIFDLSSKKSNDDDNWRPGPKITSVKNDDDNWRQGPKIISVKNDDDNWRPGPKITSVKNDDNGRQGQKVNTGEGKWRKSSLNVNSKVFVVEDVKPFDFEPRVVEPVKACKTSLNVKATPFYHEFNAKTNIKTKLDTKFLDSSYGFDSELFKVSIHVPIKVSFQNVKSDHKPGHVLQNESYETLFKDPFQPDLFRAMCKSDPHYLRDLKLEVLAYTPESIENRFSWKCMSLMEFFVYCGKTSCLDFVENLNVVTFTYFHQILTYVVRYRDLAGLHYCFNKQYKPLVATWMECLVFKSFVPFFYNQFLDYYLNDVPIEFVSRFLNEVSTNVLSVYLAKGFKFQEHLKKIREPSVLLWYIEQKLVLPDDYLYFLVQNQFLSLLQVCVKANVNCQKISLYLIQSETFAYDKLNINVLDKKLECILETLNLPYSSFSLDFFFSGDENLVTLAKDSRANLLYWFIERYGKFLEKEDLDHYIDACIRDNQGLALALVLKFYEISLTKEQVNCALQFRSCNILYLLTFDAMRTDLDSICLDHMDLGCRNCKDGEVSLECNFTKVCINRGSQKYFFQRMMSRFACDKAQTSGLHFLEKHVDCTAISDSYKPKSQVAFFVLEWYQKNKCILNWSDYDFNSDIRFSSGCISNAFLDVLAPQFTFQLFTILFTKRMYGFMSQALTYIQMHMHGTFCVLIQEIVSSGSRDMMRWLALQLKVNILPEIYVAIHQAHVREECLFWYMQMLRDSEERDSGELLHQAFCFLVDKEEAQIIKRLQPSFQLYIPKSLAAYAYYKQQPELGKSLASLGYIENMEVGYYFAGIPSFIDPVPIEIAQKHTILDAILGNPLTCKKDFFIHVNVLQCAVQYCRYRWIEKVFELLDDGKVLPVPYSQIMKEQPNRILAQTSMINLEININQNKNRLTYFLDDQTMSVLCLEEEIKYMIDCNQFMEFSECFLKNKMNMNSLQFKIYNAAQGSMMSMYLLSYLGYMNRMDMYKFAVKYSIDSDESQRKQLLVYALACGGHLKTLESMDDLDQDMYQSACKGGVMFGHMAIVNFAFSKFDEENKNLALVQIARKYQSVEKNKLSASKYNSSVTVGFIPYRTTTNTNEVQLLQIHDADDFRTGVWSIDVMKNVYDSMSSVMSSISSPALKRSPFFPFTYILDCMCNIGSNLHVIQVFYLNFTLAFGNKMYNKQFLCWLTLLAMQTGRVDVLEWIFESGQIDEIKVITECTKSINTNLINEIVRSDNVDVVKFAVKHKLLSLMDWPFLEMCIYHGSICILLFILKDKVQVKETLNIETLKNYTPDKLKDIAVTYLVAKHYQEFSNLTHKAFLMVLYKINSVIPDWKMLQCEVFRTYLGYLKSSVPSIFADVAPDWQLNHF
jgi:hypothetical protein